MLSPHPDPTPCVPSVGRSDSISGCPGQRDEPTIGSSELKRMTRPTIARCKLLDAHHSTKRLECLPRNNISSAPITIDFLQRQLSENANNPHCLGHCLCDLLFLQHRKTLVTLSSLCSISAKGTATYSDYSHIAKWHEVC